MVALRPATKGPHKGVARGGGWVTQKHVLTVGCSGLECLFACQPAGAQAVLIANPAAAAFLRCHTFH